MPDVLPQLRSALGDRYALDREIGHGGMATVYLAEDLKHRRQVAIKVLRPELGDIVGRDRFLREIGIAARLTHPRIVPLYDSGDAGGFLYYVMPYITGESLRARLEREIQLPLDEALAITNQVALALGHAHAQNVIHRDVKPENILLHDGEALVADFGIALAVSAAADRRLTQTGLAIGTPEYMSPEQATADRELDARSDVYSLACVLYEMLSGEPPYTARTAQALIAKRFVDPVPSVRRLRGTVPLGMEQALQKALAPTPADRFDSTAAFTAALAEPGTPSPAPAPCVAVLPFLNLSADPENEYFAEGITEDVIAQLSKIRALRVISRTSVMPFKKRGASLKEIGEKLGATKLVEGSVRRAGDRVRIVAQLIDAETDRHLWAETYDRELTDIFAIQTDVAFHIAAALEAELTEEEHDRIEREPTSDLQAYQLYLQGRHLFIRYTPDAIRRAIEYFKRAIARDPKYATAYASIAKAYAELAETGAMPSEAARPLAMNAVETALRLDGTLGEARCTLAYLKALWEFDWRGAEEEFRRAIELCPNSADAYDLYGRMCSAIGRFDEAIALQQHAQVLDPLAHRLDVATTMLRAGRYAEAADGAKRALEFEPRHDRARATLGWALLKQGMTDEGIAELERAVAATPEDTQWLAQLGQAYAFAGRTEDAREVLRKLEERAARGYVTPYHLAFVHTGLGEHERALELLEQAFAERGGAIYGIKGSFLLEPLRGHPRFQALLGRLNLA